MNFVQKRIWCFAGMGDVLTLVEKAEESIKADEADEMTKRIMQQKFDFNDFLKQTQMMSSMGGMGNLTKMLPGLHTWTTCHAAPVSDTLVPHVCLMFLLSCCLFGIHGLMFVLLSSTACSRGSSKTSECYQG